MPAARRAFALACLLLIAMAAQVAVVSAALCSCGGNTRTSNKPSGGCAGQWQCCTSQQGNQWMCVGQEGVPRGVYCAC